jgi:chitodextrinase
VIYDQFPATLANPGTMTLPSGIIVKWGTGTTTAGSGSVTFAAAFPTATFNVQITISGASGAVTVRPLALGATTAAGFAVWGDASESFGFNWLAVGH